MSARSTDTVRILGIDPGSRVTGFGCIDVQHGKPTLVDAGVIRCQGKPLPPRLLTIHAGISELIRSLAPDEVAVEEVFVAHSARSALVLGQARGAAIAAAAAMGDAIHEYAARRIKQAIVGTGAADKAQIQHMVTRILGIRQKLPADAADALAVAICHAHYHASPYPTAPGNTGH